MKLSRKTMFARKSPVLIAVLLSLLASAGTALGQTQQVANSVVTIELRLIEAPRADVNALISPTEYVLDAEKLRQIQDWVDHRRAKILAQPRVSTINGNAAQIRSVRELIYPTDYEAPKSAEQESWSPIPGSFKTRELGVLFNVTPTVGTNPQWVNITLVPELSQLSPLGFIKHQAIAPGGRRIAVSTPDFYSWNLTTSVVLKSGTTVLLGVHDPVPPVQNQAQDKVVLILLSATVHHLE